MPYSAGTYTLSDTIANSTPADATELQAILNDIQTALNTAFCRDGQAAATGQFVGVVSSTPQYSFSGDTDTGFGSDTGNECWMMGGGVKTLKANATGVTITGTINVSGALTFAAASITLTYVDINGATATTSPGVSDYMPVYSAGASANRKILVSDFFKIIDGLTAKSSPATADEVAIYDASGTAAKKATLTQLATGLVQTASFKAMTKQYLTSASGTYTTPTSPSPKTIVIKMIGGGGGGGAATTNGGSTGGTTTFDTLNAIGGGGGATGTNAGSGGVGGTGGTGTADLRLAGSGGCASAAYDSGFDMVSGAGGAGLFGMGAGRGLKQSAAGQAASAQSGAGGSGGASGASGGGGGGSGEYVEKVIASPSASYSYAVGDGGNGGSAGGQAGGKGGSGLIIVEEYYS